MATPNDWGLDITSSNDLAALARTRATSASVIGSLDRLAKVASIASRAGSIDSPSGICAKNASMPGSMPEWPHAETPVAFFASTSDLYSRPEGASVMTSLITSTATASGSAPRTV